MDTSQTAIEVHGLRKSFGEKEAVAGIGLDIAAGSLAGLVGPNGAGKTTSLSMMTGLLRPDIGRVVINGLDVWADPVAAKAVIGVVPDQARLFERLSGQEMLEYAGRLRGLPAAPPRPPAPGHWPVLGLLGVTVGLARGAFGLLIAVLAVLLQVLFCIALARLVTTSMARLLRSRRGKDLAAFLIVPIFVLYEFFTQVVPNAAAQGTITAASFTGVDAWLRWLPPGLAAHAIQDASDGRPGTAVARLALLAVAVVVLGWLWVRSLGRALVTANTSTQSPRVRGAALPLARYGLRGAVTARFWIYQRRDPGSLVFWAITAVIMVAVSISSIVGRNVHPGMLLASAIAGAWTVGCGRADSAGQTGPALVFEALALTSRRELRAYFSGQNIALGAVGVPLLVAISFGLAGRVQDPV